MKLSIIVPVYNVEKYLVECIESILNQKYSVYEIILVDDGSTDSSGKICDEYSKKYKNIITIHKSNAGLGMARNTGLENATGDFVGFIDSDDFYSKDYLEILNNAFIESNLDTFVSSFSRVNLESEFLYKEEVISGNYKDEDVLHKLLPRIIGSAPNLKDSIPPSVCCTIYSLNIIRENNIKFVSERDLISEDLVFNLNYYCHAKNVTVYNYVGYNYRINPHSLTTKYNKERFKKCLNLYNYEKEYLKNIEIYDECKYRLIRQFFNYIRMCLDQLNKKSCNLSKSEIIKHIDEIVGNKEVEEMLSIYPIKELGFKQKIFVYMLKYKMKYILYFIYSNGILK